jgi:steroid delta-isomerase-like uncharacterized protein
MTVQNRNLSRRWFEEVWNDRRTATIDELLSPDGVGHMESGDLVGVEPFKRIHQDFLAAFPDLKLEIEDIVSDGDDVVVRWRAAGTHAGDGLGLEATHQPVAVRGITWQRYKDGVMVEGWDCWNQEALLQRLREGDDERRGRDIERRRELADRIRSVRLDLFGEHGGPEMARRLNLPSRTYYYYESGVTVPGEVLLDFIDITGVRPAWLLRGEGPRYEDGKGPKSKVGAGPT